MRVCVFARITEFMLSVSDCAYVCVYFVCMCVCVCIVCVFACITEFMLSMSDCVYLCVCVCLHA